MEMIIASVVLFLSGYSLGCIIIGKHYRSLLADLKEKMTNIEADNAAKLADIEITYADLMTSLTATATSYSSKVVEEQIKNVKLLIDIIDEHVEVTGIPLTSSHEEIVNAMEDSYNDQTLH